MKRLAVLLGTDTYANFTPTQFCHNDVDALVHTLTEDADYAEQDVLVRKLNPGDGTTPKGLLDSIRDLAKKAELGDTILFYYAGHGTLHKGEAYTVLPDTDPSTVEQTALPLRDISNLLREPFKVNIRIFDACYSGQDVRGPADERLDEAGFTREVVKSLAAGWITLAACAENERSHSDPSLKQGVFTYYLCEAIRDIDDGQTIFPELLKVRVCEKVEEWSRRRGNIQRPTMNLAISGNVSLATRRVKKLAKSASAKIGVPTEPEQRLAKLNTLPGIGTPEHLAVLKKAANAATNALENEKTTIRTMGGLLGPVTVAKCNSAPEFLRHLLINYIVDRKLRSVHTVRRHRTAITRPSLMFNPFQAPEYETMYELDQPSDWPDSYFELRLTPAKFLADGRLFLYLCPLQTRLVLVGGSAIERQGNNNRTTISHRFFVYDKIDGIPQAVSALMKEFNIEYEKDTTEHLNYLEWELGQ